MTPMMHERVRNMFGDAGLTDGFTVQKLLYDDPGDLSTAVMVVQAKRRLINQECAGL
jgi:hypothetical protein